VTVRRGPEAAEPHLPEQAYKVCRDCLIDLPKTGFFEQRIVAFAAFPGFG
jgi:hypothetical protein